MSRRLAAADSIDVAAVTRGSFRGFLVLVMGTLLLPLVAREFAGVTTIWLSLVSVAAFAFAACHQGIARRAVWQGTAAAVGAFVLVLPLLLTSPAVHEPGPLLMTAATALVVGAAVGAGVAGTRRARSSVASGHTNGSWRKR